MNIITLLNAKSILEQIGQVKLSPKLAYKIMKFYKSIEVEEEFYENRKAELINMYAEKNEEGQPIIENNIVRLIEGQAREAQLAMQELNNTEIEMPNIRFSLSELEELQLSVADMYVLDAFIEE